jgi:hypothetical protein
MWTWNVSGGLPASVRLLMTACAAVPAPPAMAALYAQRVGLSLLN